jgi:serine O-acetyltransferase
MKNIDHLLSQINTYKQQIPLPIKLKEEAEEFADLLFNVLFDTQTDALEGISALRNRFDQMVLLACWNPKANCQSICEAYLSDLPFILEKLHMDAKAILAGDPASRTLEEVYLSYPGFYAVAIYRLAHSLYQLNFPLVPRLMTEYAHSKTGIDIHPGASIGDSFCIDHGTGVVIGETAVIRNKVKIYQGVTLGALSVKKEMAKIKRHPTIEDQVTIYANATILGGKTVIGRNSIIGGNTWVTTSIPENSSVFHTPEIKIKDNAK